MEAALGEGADLVGVARPLIADPDFRASCWRGGIRDQPLRLCNEDCRLFDPALLCTVNPELGLPGRRAPARRPRSCSAGRPRRRPGGGRRRRPGGPRMRADAHPRRPRGRRCSRPATSPEARSRSPRRTVRSGWRRVLDFHLGGLERSPVEIRLGARPARADDLAGFGELVFATGSEEVLPQLRARERAGATTERIRRGAPRLNGVERLWWSTTASAGGRASAPSSSASRPAFARSECSLLGRVRGRDPAESRTSSRLASPVPDLDALVPRAGGVRGGGAHGATSPLGEAERLPADQSSSSASAGPPAGRRLPASRMQAIGDAVVPRRVAHAIAEGRAAAEAILQGTQRGRLS